MLKKTKLCLSGAETFVLIACSSECFKCKGLFALSLGEIRQVIEMNWVRDG